MKYAKLFLVLLLLNIWACSEIGKRDPITWTKEDRNYIINELQRTTGALENELEGLSESQANFKIDGQQWSIKQIVAHLEMQNQLHYREITVLSKAPSYAKLQKITTGRDTYFTAYADNPQSGTSQWYLEPGNKFSSLDDAWQAFYKARTELLLFVENTDIDLRSRFTYRKQVDLKKIDRLKIGEVRDLHQLLLTGIAHTERHIEQIKQIKDHPEFPPSLASISKE